MSEPFFSRGAMPNLLSCLPVLAGLCFCSTRLAAQDPVGEREPLLIAVIDTGVDAAHPALKGRVVEGVNLAEPGKPTDDGTGHGTAVAGLIAGDVKATRTTAPARR